MHRTVGPTDTVFAVSLLLAMWAIPCLAEGHAARTVAAEQSDRQVQSTIDRLEQLVARQPKNPESWYALAVFYSEKAKDANLPRDLSRKYVRRASEANDWALVINPVYYEALRLKTTLLRQRATYEKDSTVRRALIAEADTIKRKADEILAFHSGG